MKVIDLMEVKNTKPPKSPTPRPQKTLWYNKYEDWVSDIKLSYPNAEAHQVDDEQVIALNSEEDKCYGRWDPIDQKGVTFNKPRSVNSVISNRIHTKKINSTNDNLRNYAHQ